MEAMTGMTCSVYVAAPEQRVRAALSRWAVPKGGVDIEAATEYSGYETAVDFFNYPNGAELAESLVEFLTAQGVDAATDVMLEQRCARTKA